MSSFDQARDGRVPQRRRRALAAGGLVVSLAAVGVTTAPSAGADPLGTIDIVTTDNALNAAEITSGADGNRWFTNALTHKVSRITPAGVVTTYTDATIDDPEGIHAGANSDLWFTNFNANTIGRITTTGTVSHFSAPSISDPVGITLGASGNPFFTNSGSNTIGRITPAGVVTSFGGTGISHPMRITYADDGKVWFTNLGNNSIGAMTAAGVVQNFTDATIKSPEGIVQGIDGALWFTNKDDNSIGRITKAGAITNYKGTGIDNPTSITVGPDHNLWFTNVGNHSIGRISVTSHLVSNFKSAALTDGPWGISGTSTDLWFTTGDGIGTIVGEGVPFAPPSISATSGNGELTVSWLPGEANGSPITGYTAKAEPGPHTCSTGGTGTACTILGLTNGTLYTVTVTATNAFGPSKASAAVALTPLRFWDVPVASPFYADIEWLAAQGIAGGYADGSFRPTKPVTRQVMAKFLYRVKGAPNGPNPSCAVAPFPDVPTSSAFCGEIKWMVGQHITKGYADGTFRPDDAVSREATAAFLYRTSGSPDGASPVCTSNAFPDVPVGAPFCGEITWMVEHNITNGYADGGFHPTDPVSRQAMAAFLHRWW